MAAKVDKVCLTLELKLWEYQGQANLIAIFQFGNYSCTVMARKPRVHFAAALYHVMCRGNQRQPIFKELAKELHQDPAVLSRGLGKLAEEFGEQTGVAWYRGDALRKLEQGKAAQKIDKVCLTPKCFSRKRLRLPAVSLFQRGRFISAVVLLLITLYALLPAPLGVYSSLVWRLMHQYL